MIATKACAAELRASLDNGRMLSSSFWCRGREQWERADGVWPGAAAGGHGHHDAPKSSRRCREHGHQNRQAWTCTACAHVSRYKLLVKICAVRNPGHHQSLFIDTVQEVSYTIFLQQNDVSFWLVSSPSPILLCNLLGSFHAVPKAMKNL